MTSLEWLLQFVDEIIWLPGLLLGFTVHELGHALVAYRLGDRSRENRERLSFNPLKHVAWLGLLSFLILGFGWAKPVRINLSHSRQPNRDDFLISAAGVTANLLAGMLMVVPWMGIAVAAALMGADGELIDEVLFGEPRDLRTLVVSSTFASYLVSINLTLATFNLIPIPPLDGFRVVASVFRALTRRAPPAALVMPRDEVEQAPPGFPRTRMVVGGLLLLLALSAGWVATALAVADLAKP